VRAPIGLALAITDAILDPSGRPRGVEPKMDAGAVTPGEWYEILKCSDYNEAPSRATRS
jgi:hypothetical protein